MPDFSEAESQFATVRSEEMVLDGVTSEHASIQPSRNVGIRFFVSFIDQIRTEAPDPGLSALLKLFQAHLRAKSYQDMTEYMPENQELKTLASLVWKQGRDAADEQDLVPLAIEDEFVSYVYHLRTNGVKKPKLSDSEFKQGFKDWLKKRKVRVPEKDSLLFKGRPAFDYTKALNATWQSVEM